MPCHENRGLYQPLLKVRHYYFIRLSAYSKFAGTIIYMKQIAIKHFVVIAFCLSAITQLKGQDRRDQDVKGNIRGTVKNTQNEPFAAATISLVRAADSTIVLKQQTNNKGQ